MRIRSLGLGAGAALLLAAPPLAALDVVELVTVAARHQRASEARPLAFEETVVTSESAEGGGSGGVEARTFRCVRVGGFVDRTLVAVDGRPPTAREARAARAEEDRRRARARSAPSPEDDMRTGRLDLLDMLPRFDFTLLRADLLEGRPCWVVAFASKPGSPQRTVRDRVLGDFAGTAWIDAAELQLLHLDGRLRRPLAVAGGLALKIRQIAIAYEARPVASGLWAPCQEEMRVDVRAALVFPYRRAFRLDFANYRPGRD